MPTCHHNTNLERYPQHSSRQVLSHGWFLFLQDCLSVDMGKTHQTAGLQQRATLLHPHALPAHQCPQAATVAARTWHGEAVKIQSVLSLGCWLHMRCSHTGFKWQIFLSRPARLATTMDTLRGIDFRACMTCLFVCLSVCLFVFLSVWLLARLFGCFPFAYLNISMSKAPQLLVSATIRLP